MIYKIRTELEQGIALLAEAEEALKAGSLDAGKLSRLEQLSSCNRCDGYIEKAGSVQGKV